MRLLAILAAFIGLPLSRPVIPNAERLVIGRSITPANR